MKNFLSLSFLFFRVRTALSVPSFHSIKAAILAHCKPKDSVDTPALSSSTSQVEMVLITSKTLVYTNFTSICHCCLKAHAQFPPCIIIISPSTWMQQRTSSNSSYFSRYKKARRNLSNMLVIFKFASRLKLLLPLSVKGRHWVTAAHASFVLMSPRANC